MREERRTRKMASRVLAACARPLGRSRRSVPRPGLDWELTLLLKDKTQERDAQRGTVSNLPLTRNAELLSKLFPQTSRSSPSLNWRLFFFFF